MSTDTRTNGPAAPQEPKGDLGHSHKTWTPKSGEQGVSNRPDDDDDDDEDIEEDGEEDATEAER